MRTLGTRHAPNQHTNLGLGARRGQHTKRGGKRGVDQKDTQQLHTIIGTSDNESCVSHSKDSVDEEVVTGNRRWYHT